MKMNAPAGTSHLFDDEGNVIPVVAGQADVQPHLVPGLQNLGWTIAGADSIVADAEPAVSDPTVSE